MFCEYFTEKLNYLVFTIIVLFYLYLFIRTELSTKNTEVNMLQNEINKNEKKLNNLTKTLSTKDKEIYRLSIEFESIKSLLEKEKTSFNVR